MNSRHLLAEEDKLRAALLGEDVPVVPEFKLPALGSAPAPGPQLLDQQLAPTPAPAPEPPPVEAPVPVPESTPAPDRDAKFLEFLKSGGAKTESKYDRASEALYSAFSGKPLSQEFFARPSMLAVEREKALGKQVGGITAGDIAAQNSALQDPDFTRFLGGEQNIRAMSADDIIKQRNGFNTGTRIGNQSTQFDTTLEFKKQQEQHDREMDELRNGYTTQRIALAQEGQKAVQRRFAGTNLVKFAETIEKDVPTVSLLQQIEEMAPGFTHGIVDTDNPAAAITEWDRIKSTLPGDLGSQLTSKEKTKLKNATLMAYDFFRRPLAGANLTDAERADYMKMLSSALLSTPEAQAGALDLIRKATGHKIRAKEAAYTQVITPEDWERYMLDGGVSSRMKIFEGAFGPAQPVEESGMDLGPGDVVPAIQDTLQQGTRAVAPVVKQAKQAVKRAVTTLPTSTPVREPSGAIAPITDGGTPPKAQTRKAYSKSTNKTYTLDANGEVLNTEDGDTRGR